MRSDLPGLDDPASRSPTWVGRKAATLAVLRGAGFPVPNAVVVPTDLTATGAVSPAVEGALSGLPARLPPPWAVRSSAIGEDGPERSMAGQFTTTLRVGPDELRDAVAACLAPARVADPGQPSGQAATGTPVATPPPGGMAVLVQAMVAAVAAGVAMTRDPVSGEDVVVVEAVAGTAEALTAGAADPRRWRVDPDGHVKRDDRDHAIDATPVLDPAQVVAVAALARELAAELGGPQDVEWALDVHGDLHVLQARPITGAARDVGPAMASPRTDGSPPPGHWSRDPFHEPVPVSAFGLEVKQRQILDQFPRLFAEFGILLREIEHVRFAGWYYQRPVPLVGPRDRPRIGARQSARRASAPPPRWAMWLLLRLHPRIRARVATARRLVAEDESMRILATWGAVRDELATDIERALDLDLAGLDDAALVAELDHRLDVITEAGWPHLQLMQAAFVVLEGFFDCCEELLGWDRQEGLVLLDGLSRRSTEPGRLVERLAARARSDPALRSVLGGATDPDPADLVALDPAFAAAFDAVVRRVGHRASTYDVVEPTLAERPELLLAQVSGALAADGVPAGRRGAVDRRREDAERTARGQLEARGDRAVATFDLALRRARIAYPIREDRVWETTSVQLALLRYLALQLGARLARRGQLGRADDVFHLSVPTVRNAVLTGTDLRMAGERARRRRAHDIANPPPLSLGGPPPGPPPLDLLPPEARLVQRAALQSAAQGRVTSQHGPSLTGVAAAAGRVTGPARLVLGPADLGRLRPGDVVVCTTASPTWSVVFPTLAGLLSDTGGALSHTAIMAREHDVPAVLGLGDITARVSPGQLVTVDGGAGTVHLHDTDQADPPT